MNIVFEGLRLMVKYDYYGEDKFILSAIFHKGGNITMLLSVSAVERITAIAKERYQDESDD